MGPSHALSWSCRLDEQANSNKTLQQELQQQQLQFKSLEARLAAMQAQRDKLLMAFEGLAGSRLVSSCFVCNALLVCNAFALHH